MPLPKTSSGLVGAGVPHVVRSSAGCWLWALRSWVIDAAGWFAVLLRLAYLGVTNAFAVLRLLPMSNRDKDVEILALRHQITVLERHLGKERVRFDTSDRALLAALLHRFPSDVAACGCWSGPTRCCAGTATWSPAVTRASPGRSGRAGRGPCVPSAAWCCAWRGRIRAGVTGASMGNCSCSG